MELFLFRGRKIAFPQGVDLVSQYYVMVLVDVGGWVGKLCTVVHRGYHFYVQLVILHPGTELFIPPGHCLFCVPTMLFCK